MYAARRLHVNQVDHQSPDGRYTVEVTREGKPVAGLKSDRITVVEEEVMYWCKANHIHGWFVNNVQDGLDDCKTYYVDEEVLRVLLSTCDKVIEASKLVDGRVFAGTYWEAGMAKPEERWVPGMVIQDPTVAKELLPTQDGCFFGNREYDAGYLKEVVRTRDWAERMLADYESGESSDIYYSSSW